jgi:membrane protease YdiL (CAAX protease family)
MNQMALRTKFLLIGLHFLPGVVFAFVLFGTMPLIATTQADLFLAQVVLVFVFLLGLELLIAQIYCKTYEGKSLKSALISSRVVFFDRKKLAIALTWSAFAVATMKGYLWLAGPVIDKFRQLPFLALPEWHYQNLDMPPYSTVFKAGLLTCMLSLNVFAEEIYFRAFLLERLKFLGRSAFLVNGLLRYLKMLWTSGQTATAS